MASVLVVALAFPAALNAAGARSGVHPKPGEIVLLRNVPTRPATREAPPGLALLIDPKPNGQLRPALDQMELSDREAGAISALVQGTTRVLHSSSPGRQVVTALSGTGNLSIPRGAATGTLPLSVLGNATRGVGSTITGALQALPFGKLSGN